MSMAGFRSIIFLALLLSSCAQVGTISGGEEDNAAPQVITHRVNPPNESVNFTAKRVEIPFDEFFRLDNPAENIRIVPPHTKIKAQMKKKTLVLSWEDTLQPNTTYAIYINNAVKDISEGNDTIIQYVFSTGETVDSLSYTVQVVDAWTNDPINKCVVGLFDPTTNYIKNFAETAANGQAHLNYIKAGSYELIAFVDENKDLIVQSHERVGFPENSLTVIDSSMVDSIPLRLFTPLSLAKMRTAVFNHPGTLLIGATRPIENERIFLNGELIPKNQYQWIQRDSVQVFIPKPDSSFVELILSSNFVNDTAKVRVRPLRAPVPITVSAKKTNNTFAPSDTITFVTNDFIQRVDTALIEVLNTKDSVTFHSYTFETHLNELLLLVDKTDLSELNFTFNDSAIITNHGNNSLQKITIQLQEARKYGGLKIDLTYYTEPVLLQLYLNGKIVETRAVSEPSVPFVITELEPGDYTFKVIRDANNNGQWDVGDFTERLQPERVDSYSTVSKLRANWDMEVTLIPAE